MAWRMFFRMAKQESNKILPALVTGTLLTMVCACEPSNNAPPTGTWACLSEWSNEREGVTVSCSAQLHATCRDNVMSTTGLIAIGSAQWTEKKEGTCYSSGDELYGNWNVVETIAKNNAARQFEQQRFDGKSLAIATRAVEHEHRVRVTSRTATRLRAVNKNGQVISCNRL